MKIELDVENLEEFIIGLNQAYNVYHKCKSVCALELEEDNIDPKLLDKLKEKSDNKYGNHDTDNLIKIVEGELYSLYNIYNKLLEIEKKEKINNET